jgi:non-canonical purine NTP pyrophosphatase (RdgB/HAM1 family)
MTPTSTQVRIVLATSNPHKLDELNAIFAAAGLVGVRLIGLRDIQTLRPLVEPAENGATFEANATIKAISYAQQLGLPALADDSGLEIDALDGRPGVISSHYCTDGRETGMKREERDAANNARVMRELASVPREKRTARFVCVMKLATPSREAETMPSVIASSRGTFDGIIGLDTEVPRGDNGFGYDPLFLVAPDYRIVSAQLPPDEKNAMSHRGHAARAMARELQAMVRAGSLV